MKAEIIDGKSISSQIKGELQEQTARLKQERGIVPGLAFILVGSDPASESYVRSKGKACAELGYHSITERLPESATHDDILRLISRFNTDPAIHGILVQLPLPSHLDEHRIIEAIDFRKDVDGIHPANVGRLVLGLRGFRSCTPAGVQELLVRSGHDPGGKHVVIVGRSNIVGKPVMNMLMQKQRGANAVVTIAHTGAGDISRFVRQADIVIAAMGRAGAITGAMLKPGSVVIDVGINRVDDASQPRGYRIVGDVDFASAAEVAAAITPVPGGVGPMTIAMLMQNTYLAAAGKVFH